MGYGRANNWPGRGPFNHLPPWQRPSWIYGRGPHYYCLYASPYNAQPPVTPQDEAAILNEQKKAVEAQIKAMQEALTKIQERLTTINK